MKKNKKIIIGLIFIIILGAILYIGYSKYYQNNYSENIKNLYLNSNTNDIKEIPSQSDE
ncbi:hypothetical protein EOM39_02745 [Candidatus Gracilibacteria bacterium]|nr:hypothetical protein [Candidatus Gracilibacteria bacterium]